MAFRIDEVLATNGARVDLIVDATVEVMASVVVVVVDGDEVITEEMVLDDVDGMVEVVASSNANGIC